VDIVPIAKLYPSCLSLIPVYIQGVTYITICIRSYHVFRLGVVILGAYCISKNLNPIKLLFGIIGVSNELNKYMTFLAYKENPIQKNEFGYISATLMCKVNNKKVNDWLRCKSFKQYVNAISIALNIPVDELVIIQRGGPGDQGTWIHPRLALKLARWISLEFEMWCDNHIDISDSGVNNKDSSGFIYLAQAATTQWFKIGMSKTPYKRLSSLQTGSPLEVTLIHRIFTLDMPALEKALHEYYNAYWLRGEWFNLPQECVLEFPSVANLLDTSLEQTCLPSHNVLNT
jgi:hypothetical protein